VRPLDLGRMLAGRLRPALLGQAAGHARGTAVPRVERGLGAAPARRGRRPRSSASTADLERVSAEFADQVRISLQPDGALLELALLLRQAEPRVRGVGHEAAPAVARAYIITRVADLLDTKSLVIVDLGCGRGEEQALLELIASRLAAARATRARRSA